MAFQILFSNKYIKHLDLADTSPAVSMAGANRARVTVSCTTVNAATGALTMTLEGANSQGGEWTSVSNAWDAVPAVTSTASVHTVEGFAWVRLRTKPAALTAGTAVFQADINTDLG